MTTRVTLAQIRKEARRVFGKCRVVQWGALKVVQIFFEPAHSLAFGGHTLEKARRFALETLAAMPGKWDP